MYYVTEKAGAYVPVEGLTYITPDGIQYSPSSFSIMADAALEAIGVYRVSPPEIPEGMQIVSLTFQMTSQGVQAFPIFEAIPVPPVVEVTNRQFRLALIQLGAFNAVNAALLAADLVLKTEWEYANTFVRNHPMIDALASQLGYTPEQIDGLFALAAGL